MKSDNLVNIIILGEKNYMLDSALIKLDSLKCP